MLSPTFLTTSGNTTLSHPVHDTRAVEAQPFFTEFCLSLCRGHYLVTVNRFVSTRSTINTWFKLPVFLWIIFFTRFLVKALNLLVKNLQSLFSRIPGMSSLINFNIHSFTLIFCACSTSAIADFAIPCGLSANVFPQVKNSLSLSV